MFNFLKIGFAKICLFIIFVAKALKYIFIIIIAQSMIVFLFILLSLLREIAIFLRFLLGEEK